MDELSKNRSTNQSVKTDTKQVIRAHRSNSASMSKQPNNDVNDLSSIRRATSIEAWSTKPSTNSSINVSISQSVNGSNKPLINKASITPLKSISPSMSRKSSTSTSQSISSIKSSDQPIKPVSLATDRHSHSHNHPRSKLELIVQSIFDSLHLLRLLFTLKIVLNPFSRGKRAFDMIVIVMVIYSAFMVPYYIAFDPDLSSTLLPLDIICTVSMALDIFIQTRTGFLDSAGNICYDSRFIARRYWRRGFMLDVIGTVPLEIFGPLMDSSNARVVHLLKINELLRASRLAYNDRLAAFNSPMARIAKLLFMFFYMAHLFACIFFFITFIEPESETWVTKAGLGSQSPARQYIASLYWSMTSLVSVGYGDLVPVTVYEQAVVIPILLMSALIYASIFSTMSYSIETITATVRRYQSRMDQVKEFVDIYELPRELRQKLFSYQNAAWNQNKGFEMDAMLSHLPLSVRSEVMMCINEPLIQRVPMLKQCSDRFLEAIVLRMSTQVCLDGDYVCKQGDASTEMFFIRTGSVDVWMIDEHSDEALIAQLRSTSDCPFFGETSLLLGEPRTASVKATSKCVLSTLSQAHFFEVMSMFPEDAASFRDAAAERIQADIDREAERRLVKISNKQDRAYNEKPILSKHMSRLDALEMVPLRASAAVVPLDNTQITQPTVDVNALQQQLAAISAKLDLAVAVIQAISKADPNITSSAEVDRALQALTFIDKK